MPISLIKIPSNLYLFCCMYLLFLSAISHAAALTAIKLSPEQGMRIAERVRFNETGGKVAALVHWNKGERHPSLGIGHFIWYPQQVEAEFTASFPELMAYLKRQGIQLPYWLGPEAYCPWADRASFIQAKQSGNERIKTLYALMQSTVHLQVEFMILRLNAALPIMLGSIQGDARKQQVSEAFEAVLFAKPAGNNDNKLGRQVSENGAYALLDYVNFKGEGTNLRERYGGYGWGLLQVLEQLNLNDPSPLAAFSLSAKAVLQRRIDHAPAVRKEARWRAGWFKRVDSYAADR